jgi:hypothetical protein
VKFITLHGSLLAGSLLVPGFSCHCASPTDGALPDASQVIERVVQRADDVACAGEAGKYAFEKHSISEELDTLGKATKTTERTYEVIPIQGVPFSRLVRIGNRNLTEQETKAQNRKELEFRKKVARNDAETMAEKNGDWLDKDLVDRYDFKVEGRDSFQSRPVLILSFNPRKNHGVEKTIEDKVLNRLAGTLWVDEKEAEIAQLKVGLTEDLSLGWFGAVGSLKQFDLKLVRAPLADGVWVTQKQVVMMCGRKIVSSMRHSTLEESSNFRKP